MSSSFLPNNRYFTTEARPNEVAAHLYQRVADLPLICPHGHVNPQLFADADYSFGSPAELFLIPDHYVFRMLYSQGIPMEALGIRRQDGGEVEQDHRKIWQIFAENFHLFRGTPTGMWLKHELYDLFGIEEKLTGANAPEIYDQIEAGLNASDFKPRLLFKRFNIEVLCTTDSATDLLEDHHAIQASGWDGRILPTFRPDAVVNLDHPDWRQQIDRLSNVAGIAVDDYVHYIQALEHRRAYFKAMGATATDHAALTAYTAELSAREADTIFQRALKGMATPEDARRFTAHMLMEMARMSLEDGLVMQLHIGAYRNHNPLITARFGPDTGADIPVTAEFTRNLAQLLRKYGNEPGLSVILFNLDETNYARELAPLAGHYPIIKLGPPWWFHDSLNGLRRFFDQVMETAGLYNTVGFNDDTRAFPSIPARHDLWRRAASDWVASLVIQGIVDVTEGEEMVYELAYGLAKRAYHL